MRKNRFIVAVGNAILSATIRAWVTERPWLRLVESPASTKALVRCANATTDAVLVTDTQLEGQSIVPLLAELYRVNPGLRIVVLLQQPDGPMAAQVIRAGAMGIVGIGDMEGFQQAIVQVLRGDLAMRGDLGLRLMRAAYQQFDRATGEDLPAKECGKCASNRLSSTKKEVRLLASSRSQ